MSNWTHKSHSNIARVNTASHFKTDRRENSWLIAVVNLHKISNWTHKLHVTTQLHISRPIAEKIVDLLQLSICIKSQTELTTRTWQHLWLFTFQDRPLVADGSSQRNVYFFDRRRVVKIRNVGRENEGNFSCSADNSIGSQKSNVVNLNVLCKFYQMGLNHTELCLWIIAFLDKHSANEILIL